jgi:3-deoxy-D-manno-octulosonic-acid transferase
MKQHHRSLQKAIYNGVLLPLGFGSALAVSLFHRKLREAFEGRRNFHERWIAAGERFRERPVWFHVSSVGEFEQAKPLIAILREDHPDIPVAITFSSPSGFHYATTKERLNGENSVKFIDYLPIDFARNARFCLACLNPRLLVFVKFDLWPNLIWEAKARGIPAVLIDATLSETSQRITGLGKRFYSSVYGDLERILAISEHDARRFRACNPDHRGISVGGDTRFDRVMERKQRSAGPGFHIDTGGCFVMIAGSTWPQDEEHLLKAVSDIAATEHRLRFIIAPHEPAPDRVASLSRWAQAHNLETAVLSEVNRQSGRQNAWQVLIIDTVGVLAETYCLGSVAYVGGSFSSGVHNIIEPAIMGMPVLFGPVNKNSWEALELLRIGAAIQVKNGQDVSRSLRTLLDDGDKRRLMGEKAKEFVKTQLGASNRCMAAMEDFI